MNKNIIFLNIFSKECKLLFFNILRHKVYFFTIFFTLTLVF